MGFFHKDGLADFSVDEIDQRPHTQSSKDRSNTDNGSYLVSWSATKQIHADSKKNAGDIGTDANDPEFPQPPFV